MSDAIYTQLPIKQTMLKTAFAMVVGTLAMSGYNIADTYFIGKLPDTSPLAAMGFTLPVIMIVVCLLRGFIIGISTSSAHAIGNKKKEKAAKLITAGLIQLIIFSCFISIIGFFTITPIFTFLQAKDLTFNLIYQYMSIWYLGCVTASLSMAGNDLLISVGDSKFASGIIMSGMILNIILDPLFIFGLPQFSIEGAGIIGAAIATVLSQFIVAIITLFLLWKRHNLIILHLPPLKIIIKIWLIITRFAIPAAIGMLMMPIGSFVLTYITAKFGDAAVAATGAAGRLEMAAFIFPMAMGISLLPMIGQNYGAKLYSRIIECRQFAMMFAIVFLFLMGIIYYFFAKYLVCLFASDKDVQNIMILCMHIIPWGFWGIEVHRYAGFFFTGCGKPAVSAWLNIFRIIGLMIPFSLIALYFKSLSGLFFARLFADIIAGSVGLILARQMTHKLPRDGEVLLNNLNPSFANLLPMGLRPIASAQADIDHRSSTQ